MFANLVKPLILVSDKKTYDENLYQYTVPDYSKCSPKRFAMRPPNPVPSNSMPVANLTAHIVPPSNINQGDLNRDLTQHMERFNIATQEGESHYANDVAGPNNVRQDENSDSSRDSAIYDPIVLVKKER